MQVIAYLRFSINVMATLKKSLVVYVRVIKAVEQGSGFNYGSAVRLRDGRLRFHLFFAHAYARQMQCFKTSMMNCLLVEKKNHTRAASLLTTLLKLFCQVCMDDGMLCFLTTM